VTLKSCRNWVLAPLALFIMGSGGVLMSQSNELMIGVSLENLPNKNAWFVFILLSVFFFVPSHLLSFAFIDVIHVL
jgi:hypothetical protein